MIFRLGFFLFCVFSSLLSLSQRSVLWNNFENHLQTESGLVYDNVISNSGEVPLIDVAFEKALAQYGLSKPEPIEGNESLISAKNKPTFFEFPVSQDYKADRVLKASYSVKPIVYNLPQFYVRKVMRNSVGARFSSKSIARTKNKNNILYANKDYESGVCHGSMFLLDKKGSKFLIIGNHKDLYSPLHMSLFSVHSFLAYVIDEVAVEEVPNEEYLLAKEVFKENISRERIPNEGIKKSKKIVAFLQRLELLNKKYPSDNKLVNYYRHVYKAEKFILKNNLLAALKEYNLAFRYHRPFVLDRSNARTCILKYPRVIDKQVLKDYYALIFGSEEYASWSFGKLIEKKPEYKILDLKNDLSTLNYNKVDYFNVDSLLLSKLKIIEERDQTNFRNLEYQELKQIDSMNLTQLMDLYRESDEISERTVHKEGMNIIESVIHHCSRYGWDQWIEVLYRDVKRGYYPSFAFADHIDNYFKNNLSVHGRNSYECLIKVYMTETAFPLHSRFVYLDKLANSQPKRHVDLRSQIYLGDYSEQLGKYLFNFKRSLEDRDFFLNNTMDYNFYPANDDGSLSDEAIKFDEQFTLELEDYFLQYDVKILNRRSEINSVLRN